MEKNTKTWGEWAFFLGALLAIVLAFFPTLVEAGTAGTVLVILGALVGFWNITTRETGTFLLAAVAILLVGAGGLQNVPVIGDALSGFTSNLVAFTAPAAFIVALKAVIDTGKSA